MGRGKEQFNCNNSAGFVRLLRADEIECRVSVINERGLSLLLFKDARVDQKILDETFTPFGWRRTHQSIDGNLYCTVEIWDKEKQQWISKQDVGTVSYSEKEKGQASDSFKRACFNWGIGRELYTAPFIWISAENVSIKPKGDRYTTSEHFLVRAIDYNEEREISYLMIVNGKGKKVFEMGKPRKADGKKPVPASNEDIGANIITEIQRAALEKELKRTGVLMEAVLGRYNIQSLEEMTEDVYTNALAGLKRTKTKAA
ncbi:MAG: hypothetical protein HFH04_07620 [Dorea sp.]|nr:hypothetical protein [Dorea sp.]